MAKELEPKMIERIVCAREEGAAIWQIAEACDLSMTKVADVVRQHAPHVKGNNTAVRLSWRAHQLSEAGKGYQAIGEALGVSKATAFRAAAIGMQSANRRKALKRR